MVPAVTFPKFMLPGVAESRCRMPRPLKATRSIGELDALLTSETLPVALVVSVGANTTVRAPDCPAETVNGKAWPAIAKPAPLTVAWETDKLVLPELLKVRICELLVPTSTSPKLTGSGLAERLAVCWAAVVIPVQPETLNINTSAQAAKLKDIERSRTAGS